MHQELRLLVQPNARKPGQVVCFLGKQLCFFENGCRVPEIGTSPSVMITRAIFHKTPDGHFDFSKVMALLIRPVTDQDYLLHFDGFVCSGSMCRTTTSIWQKKQPSDWRWPGHSDFTWATPGSQVLEISNVNRPYDQHLPPQPGVAYFKEHEGRLRCEGLIDLKDASYQRAIRL